jgi:5'-nucleotidase
LAASIKATRNTEPNVLLVDAGGEFTGSSLWDQLKDRSISTVMTRMQFDAMTVGFPEFNDGSAPLGRFIKEVRFPLLSSNINVERDPVLVDQIWPFVVIDKGNERIGIVGYSSEDIRQRAHPSTETRIDQIESAVKFSVRMVKSMGVNKIIAVSHAGYARDKEIARTIEDIDVIVGGNSKTLLANKIKGAEGPYPMVAKGPTGKPVLIVQAGAFGAYLGKLDVVFDSKGVPKSWKGDPIALDHTIAEDAEMRQALEVLEATASQAADSEAKPSGAIVR